MGVLGKAIAVAQALLGIAVGTIGAVKKGLAKLADGAMDPLLRRQVEKERERNEKRQTDIDNEKREILGRAKRDGNWTDNALGRYEELNRESAAIGQRLGLRPKEVEAAPDDYDVVVVDREHMHRLEWYVGQATDRTCRCGLPMILRFPGTQANARFPSYFWACTGWYLGKEHPRYCNNKDGVSDVDLGVLLRRDNEALAMDRSEMRRRASDQRWRDANMPFTFSVGIRNDIRGLQGQVFSAYRCPIHRLGMVLMRKRWPKDDLDEWYLKCPSPLPHNEGRGCRQMVKLNTVAQILAVRKLGTGEIF